MKKILYISSFIFLGVLVQFLVHAVVEIVYINLLINRYEIFGLGLSFSTWEIVHLIFAVLFFIIGVYIGFKQGLYWWKQIYEKSSSI